MILNIHRVWYSSQNKQQDEESLIKKDPRIIQLASQSQNLFLVISSVSSLRGNSLSSPKQFPTRWGGHSGSTTTEKTEFILGGLTNRLRAPASPSSFLPWDLLGHHGREPGHDNPDLSSISSFPHPLYYFFFITCPLWISATSSVITPKMLVSFVSQRRTPSPM